MYHRLRFSCNQSMSKKSYRLLSSRRRIGQATVVWCGPSNGAGVRDEGSVQPGTQRALAFSQGLLLESVVLVVNRGEALQAELDEGGEVCWLASIVINAVRRRSFSS
jgi:hypothetical protein